MGSLDPEAGPREIPNKMDYSLKPDPTLYHQVMDDLEDEEEEPSGWAKAFVVLEAVVLLGLVAALVVTVTVEGVKGRRFVRLRLWQWVALVIVIISGLSAVRFFTFLVFTPAKYWWRVHRYVVYILEEIKWSVDVTIWLGLVLVAWYLWFRPRLMHSHGNLSVVLTRQATRLLIAMVLGSFLWTLKNVLYLKLKANLHYVQLYERIRRTVIDFHGIQIIYTFNGGKWRFLTSDKNKLNGTTTSDSDIIDSTKIEWTEQTYLSQVARIFKGIKWILGNGKSINFWNDNWLDDFKLEHLRGLDDPHRRLSDFITINKTWDVNALKIILPNEVVQKILKIRIPISDLPDRLIWKDSPDGNYRVKNGYKKVNSNNTNTNTQSWIWKTNLPPNIKNFLWKCVSDSLPTKVRLNKHVCRVAYDCILCDSHHEDLNHLFLNCQITRNMINDINVKMNANFEIRNYTANFCDNMRALAKDRDFTLLCFLWLEIWTLRNNMIFNSVALKTNTVLSAIRNYTNWILEHPTKKESRKQLTRRHNIKWLKPIPGFHKLNFDASWRDGDGGYTGIIIRDSEGSICSFDRMRITADSTIKAEALALLHGICRATQLGIKKLEIEGDNLAVINALKGKWTTPWEISTIMEDIRSYSKQVDSVKIYHCFREGNQAADFLARLNLGNDYNSCNSLYEHFCTIIRKDDLGVSFSRERA